MQATREGLNLIFAFSSQLVIVLTRTTIAPPQKGGLERCFSTSGSTWVQGIEIAIQCAQGAFHFVGTIRLATLSHSRSKTPCGRPALVRP